MVKEKEKIVVFIADDNLEDRNLFKESFKKADIKAKVFSFDSEKKLMNSLGQPTACPDIIFLAFNLENETAITCLKWIRLKRKFTNVPVVIFSPFSYLKDIKDAFENGASLFIPKPIFIEDSTKTLKAVFHSKWRRDLLNSNGHKFVLTSNIENSDRLCWSNA
jgi:response regulator RpfG family c-di-GMP phosphodiesterase